MFDISYHKDITTNLVYECNFNQIQGFGWITQNCASPTILDNNNNFDIRLAF